MNNPPKIYPDIKHESRDMDCCMIFNEHNDLYQYFTMISKEIVLFVTRTFIVFILSEHA